MDIEIADLIRYVNVYQRVNFYFPMVSLLFSDVFPGIPMVTACEVRQCIPQRCRMCCGVAKQLLRLFGAQEPGDVEEMEQLPGYERKWRALWESIRYGHLSVISGYFSGIIIDYNGFYRMIHSIVNTYSQ